MTSIMCTVHTHQSKYFVFIFISKLCMLCNLIDYIEASGAVDLGSTLYIARIRMGFPVCVCVCVRENAKMSCKQARKRF